MGKGPVVKHLTQVGVLIRVKVVMDVADEIVQKRAGCLEEAESCL